MNAYLTRISVTAAQPDHLRHDDIQSSGVWRYSAGGKTDIPKDVRRPGVFSLPDGGRRESAEQHAGDQLNGEIRALGTGLQAVAEAVARALTHNAYLCHVSAFRCGGHEHAAEVLDALC